MLFIKYIILFLRPIYVCVCVCVCVCLTNNYEQLHILFLILFSIFFILTHILFLSPFPFHSTPVFKCMFIYIYIYIYIIQALMHCCVLLSISLSLSLSLCMISYYFLFFISLIGGSSSTRIWSLCHLSNTHNHTYTFTGESLCHSANMLDCNIVEISNSSPAISLTFRLIILGKVWTYLSPPPNQAMSQMVLLLSFYKDDFGNK